LNPIILVTANFFFLLGMWQLDHFVAPLIWKTPNKEIEIWRFPYLDRKLKKKTWIFMLTLSEFYILCYLSIFIGWFLGLIWGAF